MTESINAQVPPVATDALRLRKATREDCDILVELINFAGEGLPLHLWTKLAGPDQDAWDVGRSRAARETGGFSYRNSRVAEIDDIVVGATIGYPMPKAPQPVDEESVPPIFVPVLELENIAAGTYYVNALATIPEARGLGIGTRLLSVSEQDAASNKCRGLSLIVSDTNTAARRLYRRLGYREVAGRPIIKEGWDNDGSHWILMVKDWQMRQDLSGRVERNPGRI